MVIIHPAGLYNKFYFKKEMVRMAVYKDNATGKWRVIYRFTDWTGKSRQTQKRGFQTKKEEVEWEREQMRISQKKLDMTFGNLPERQETEAEGEYLEHEGGHNPDEDTSVF